MRYKRSRFARFFVRSFLFSVFSKCGRFISKRILPFCLCLLVLGLSLAVPSYAANTDGNMDFLASSASVSCFYQDLGTVDYVSLTPSTTVLTWKNREAFRIICPTAPGGSTSWNSDPIRFVQSFTVPDLKANHEYTLDFWYAYNTAVHGLCTVYLEVYDSSFQNVLKTQFLYGGDTDVPNDTWAECNFTFKPDLSGVSSGYHTKLVIQFMQVYNASSWAVHIGNQIYFNDNDDNTGMLNGILNWLSRIYHSIAGGTDREGVTHTGIVQGIQNGLTALGNNMNTWLTGVKNGINDKLEAVKTAINNAIAGIQQWFIDLKDNILNGLKSLFIPSDGYFSQKKTELETWLTAHFGALWQGPNVLLDILRKLVTLHPVSPAITFPGVKITWQGEEVQIIEPIQYSFSWLEDSSNSLHALWLVYRGFVTVLLFVAFINYIKRKYETVFGGMEGAQ